MACEFEGVVVVASATVYTAENGDLYIKIADLVRHLKILAAAYKGRDAAEAIDLIRDSLVRAGGVC